MKNENKKRILSVTLKHEYDEDADTSYLGKYVRNRIDEFTINLKHQTDCIENMPHVQEKLDRIYSFLESDRPICEEHENWHEENCEVCQEEKEYTDAMYDVEERKECEGCRHIDRNTFEYFQPNHENYLGEPVEEIREYCIQGFERMESLNNSDWSYLSIGCVATVSIPSGTSSVTDEVQSWCGGVESDCGDYIKEVEQDQISDVKSQLTALGFSKRAIVTAFKSMKEEN